MPTSNPKLRVALVLSGCGFLDGSEITEAVSCLIHLARHRCDVSTFAPDTPQPSVINHATGQPDPAQHRNILAEAARIARGHISPLATLQAEHFDGLVFPGGFGAAKNLSNFAERGPDCALLPDVQRAITALHRARKPIALCCIAPVLAARVLGTKSGGQGVTLTIGNDPATAAAVTAMGATHAPRSVRDACVDEPNHVVTSPAYMYHATPHEVFLGIGAMVDEFVAMLATTAAPTR